MTLTIHKYKRTNLTLLNGDGVFCVAPETLQMKSRHLLLEHRLMLFISMCVCLRQVDSVVLEPFLVMCSLKHTD